MRPLVQVGIFVTNQNPPGTDMVSALQEQYQMIQLARDKGWDAVATGQHYLSEGMMPLSTALYNMRMMSDELIPELRQLQQ
jgi:hypothetical protein